MLDAELERVLAPEFLGELGERSVDDLRSLREECTVLEQKVSYLRRLVHARIDIVARELQRRAGGADPDDIGGLVDELKEALAGNVHAPGHSRMVTRVAPPQLDEVTAELHADLGSRDVDSLPGSSDADLQALAYRLGELDQRYSQRRRALFATLDALTDELTRRYGSGEASVESLLG